ncbi:MAG: ATP-dependent Clp protease proteolytic subunit [Planctomycetaceae bacterium]
MFNSAADFSPFTPMNQRARQYSQQRQMGIGDLLLDNRIVFLDGVIHDGSANMIVMKLLYLQSENRHQDIHFYINSPGGSVTATMAIYDTMQYLECDICTYCVGLAASGGAVLIAGGSEKNGSFSLTPK